MPVADMATAVFGAGVPVGFHKVVIVSELRFGWAGCLSCGPFVLVDQPAEDIAASYSRSRQVGDRGYCHVGAVWWQQTSDAL